MGYFDYVFGLGVLFCVWDAIGCGANDVANSFATAVNSKTLSMKQAMVIATVMELVGAMTLGTYNASTVRGSIINTAPFKDNLGSLLLGMFCVVFSSSTLNFLSNRYGWATSSTHAIIGALIGVGVASGAGVTWGYIVTETNGQVTGQNGLGAVVASFVISPVLAGLIGALIYSIVKYGILLRGGERSFWWALAAAPFIYATVAGFEAWLIGWKSPRLPSLSDGQTLGLFWGTFGCVLVLTFLFLTPYMRRKVWLGWTKLNLLYLPVMILPDQLLVKLIPGIDETAPSFDSRHLRGEAVPEDEAWQWSEGDLKKLAIKKGLIAAPTKTAEVQLAIAPAAATDASQSTKGSVHEGAVVKAAEVQKAEQPELSHWKQRKATYWAAMKTASTWEKVKLTAVFVFFIGVDRDIADYGHDREDVQELHSEEVAERFYGKTEQVFRFLQVLTSSVASFAHGANDVALSVGPLATMYSIWSNGTGRGNVPKSSVVLDWQLAVGALSLVTGLWLYGYNMMRVLGNRLTFHSPARGFAMEMGAAITVLIAARNGIPVSTTNCIVGATMGVGLMNGNWRAVNWKLFAFTVTTWIFTVPFCALLSGCLYALIAYSPQADCNPITVRGFGAKIAVNGVNITSSANGILRFWPTNC